MRKRYYQLVRHVDYRGSGSGSIAEEIEEGVSTESSEEFSVTTGITVGVTVGVEASAKPFGVGASTTVETSVSTSLELGYSRRYSVQTFRSRKVAVTYDVPANHAGALWSDTHELLPIRGDGTLVTRNSLTLHSGSYTGRTYPHTADTPPTVTPVATRAQIEAAEETGHRAREADAGTGGNGGLPPPGQQALNIMANIKRWPPAFTHTLASYRATSHGVWEDPGMPTNQAAAAGLDDDTSWTALYEQAGDEHSDYVSEVRSAVEYGLNDPEDTVEMTCAAAETAGAAGQALSSTWSLYPPQDAATVASALLVQLRHNADALTELVGAVGRIVERGEAELPVPAGTGEPANLADALATLRTVATTVNGLVDRHASTTVRALHAAPSTAVLPADVHETVGAVAALLAKQHDQEVTLNRRHLDGAYEDDGSGFGCGCDVTIAADGEEFNFHRGDSEWALTRESDGKERSGGVTTFSNWETLSTTLKTAHPQQLTDDILRIIATDK